MAKPTKPLLQQAKAFLRARYLMLGTSRHALKQQADAPPRIHSIRTFEAYAANIAKAAEALQVPYIKYITADQAHGYLLERAAAGYSQKQLDSDRRALHLLTGADLAKVHAIVRETRQSRAYTAGQVALITRHQTPAHALATQLAYRAGLRGQELLTLRRPDEGTPPSRHRQWHPDRFQGRDGLRYWVTGKGGLVREVLLPTALATQLEARRLAQPRPVKDRGVYGIMQRYALPGGNAWESAFSAASKRALGWSTGAHGLRHAYAQERYTELMRAFPLPDATARAIVAGELGHFRGEITETYLR